uniref:SprT-like domain-containing protein n=1 Tax=Oreochromis aureus TaxID=47969 RepID=A0A668SAB3_OREAU
MDEDFLLAIRLQEQFDQEYRRPLSIVDESWEMLDPSPDIRAMFLEFNDMFFWGKLSGVEVKWSSRMTLCAGVCSYEGQGGLCSIRLSEPLLKLRPRKDLVQTLLHEMIHALLFVTQNNRDRDGHGPEFCKHMNRINKASGTKITIYHSFHDEVDMYRQHWWRCNGPCQKRKPYFGYVKRAMNRAPSSLDPWWEDHQRTCGGTYTKIKEPEGYGKKGQKNSKTSEKKATGSGKPSSTTTGNMPVHSCVLSFNTLCQQTRKCCSYFKHFKHQ